MQISHLTEDHLQELVEQHSAAAVSLYMPTHRTGKETRQDPIRFKNLLKKAKEQLAEIDAENADAIVAPAEEIPEDVATPFWRNGADGLALFLAKGFARCYKLPLDVPELMVLSNQFHIKPLMGYLQDDGKYYVLAVSQNRVRLLNGSKYNLAEMEVESLPDDLRDALLIDENQSTLQWHTAQGGASSPAHAGDAVYHGQGAGEDDKKKMLLQYFHRIDRALVNFLSGQETPLVFAGVEYLFPIYQDTNEYRGLVDTPVTGNPDEKSAEELHGPTWEVVEPQYSANRAAVLEKFGLAASQGKASADLIDVLPAAVQGRVEKLLVGKERHRWGTVDPATGKPEFREENTAETCDLVDYAVARTLQHGGAAYLMDPDELPDGGDVAAIFRY